MKRPHAVIITRAIPAGGVPRLAAAALLACTLSSFVSAEQIRQGETQRRPETLPATLQKALFYAYDALAYPGQPVELAARLLLPKFPTTLPGVTVGFYLDSKTLGFAKTDGHGFSRIYWTPPAAGDYSIHAKITQAPDRKHEFILGLEPASLIVAARDRSTRLLVSDLDHTVVSGNILAAMAGVAPPMPGAAEALSRLSGRYTICYFTHRPDPLTPASKSWLTRHGFPRGVLLVSEIRQALGSSGTFKSSLLSSLVRAFPGTEIGVGDRISDARAYLANGMTAYLIPHYKRKAEEMLETAGEIRGLGGGDRLQVVSSWGEILQGIFEGKRFPPEAFCTRLETEAAIIE